MFVSSVGCATDDKPDDKGIELTQESTDVPSDTNIAYNKLPTVLIVILFRNKAHLLPHFFACLNRIEYPKDRISLW